MKLNGLMNTEESVYTTIVTHDLTYIWLLTNGMNKRKNMDVNVVTSLDTISKEREVQLYCAEENILVEMCPCSEISINMVRVVPEHPPMDVRTNRLMYRDTSHSMFSRMSWYTNMIRSMSMGTMCYDWAIALMLTKSMMLALTGTTLDERMEEDPYWREHYSRRLEQLRNVD